MTEAMRTARGRLLRRGRQRDGEWTQLALELGGDEAGAGGGPIARAQLEEAVARPVGQDTEEVAQVGLGVELVQTRGGDEGEEVAAGLAVVVAAYEEPGLAAGGDAAQLALGLVVGELDAAVVEEASQWSGNITHNLRHAIRSLQSGDTTRPAWAAEFDRDVAAALDQHDADALTRLIETDAGRSSHPSLDHYLPLLYAVGASDRDDQVSYPIEGWDLGSLSMRSVRFDPEA